MKPWQISIQFIKMQVSGVVLEIQIFAFIFVRSIEMELQEIEKLFKKKEKNI